MNGRAASFERLINEPTNKFYRIQANLYENISLKAYLTFADRFMIVSYIVLGACLASTILLMRHTDARDEASATRVYRLSLLLILPLSVALYALAFLTR